jgi:hypothetical protein
MDLIHSSTTREGRQLRGIVGGGYEIYPRAMHKGTSSLIMLTAWLIWKHRNAVVFNATLPDTASLFDTIPRLDRHTCFDPHRGIGLAG